MEVGALARMTLSGNYSRGISVMDRIVAKAYEAEKVCNILSELLAILKIGKADQKVWQVPETGKGMELIEAERGAVGYWLTIENKKVKNYTILPPSTWNMSPTDQQGVKGTVEQALIGTEINNIKEPVEVGRIVRSFDPCLNCAAHIISDRYKPLTIEII